MKFVQLNTNELVKLRIKGYNVLTSPMPLDHENPTWYPKSVDNLWEYLESLSSVPFAEDNVLVIEDAINNIRNQDLIGVVWVD